MRRVLFVSQLHTVHVRANSAGSRHQSAKTKDMAALPWWNPGPLVPQLSHKHRHLVSGMQITLDHTICRICCRLSGFYFAIYM